MKSKKLLWVLLALVIIIAVSISKKQDNVLRVGVISSLTGNAAYYGQSNMEGAEVGLMIAKERYPNLKMEMFHQDSLFTPKGGIDAYNTLRSQNKIDAVVSQASNVGVAVQPLALKDGVLQISASVLANNYSTPHDLSFRLTPKADVEIMPVIRHIQSKGYKKIAILAMKNDIGISLADSLSKNAQEASIEIVAKELFAPDASDFRTQLAKIKAQNPDVIYLGSLASHTVQILKQASELNINNVNYISFRAVEDPILTKNASNLLSNLIYTNAFDEKSTEGEMQIFLNALNKKYPGKVPTSYHAEAYQAVLFIAEAFNICGKDYGCIQKTLDSFKNHTSVFGPLTFDENGDVTYEFFLKTIRDGKFVKLEE